MYCHEMGLIFKKCKRNVKKGKGREIRVAVVRSCSLGENCFLFKLSVIYWIYAAIPHAGSLEITMIRF